MSMEFFSQRLAGGIQDTLTLNASIAQTLVNPLAPLLLNTAMLLFYLVLMPRQSPWLTLIAMTTLALILLAHVISEKRINITRVQMRDSGKRHRND